MKTFWIFANWISLTLVVLGVSSFIMLVDETPGIAVLNLLAGGFNLYVSRMEPNDLWW